MAEHVTDLHQLLIGRMLRLHTDFQPYGSREREGPDCSCGCKYFKVLDDDDLRYDWGVCVNPESPRFTLLTFEHQGCEWYEDSK